MRLSPPARLGSGVPRHGLALHNVTEGIGIASRLLKVKVPLRLFAALTLLAGGPAVIGLLVELGFIYATAAIIKV